MEAKKLDLNIATNTTCVILLKVCPLCQSKNTIPVKTEKNHFSNSMHSEVKEFEDTWIQLLKCKDCSFRFTKEIPASKTFFKNRYDNGWIEPSGEVDSNRKSEILNTMFRMLKQYKTVERPLLLDVGSYSGKLLYSAEKEGYRPEGIELNPKLAKYTQEKLGYRTINAEVSEVLLDENYYDVITIIDVLEHLQFPDLILEKLNFGLKPGGVIYIKVPNAPMQIVKQNIANFLGITKVGVFGNFAHINHFNVSSLSKVLRKKGYEVVKVEMAKSEEWQESNIFYLLKNAFRKVFHLFSKIIYLVTGFPIGLNLIVIAKKI